MKKSILLSAGLLIACAAQTNAQGWGGTGVPTTTTGDDVGIGLTNPSAYLHIAERPAGPAVPIDFFKPKFKIETNFQIYNPNTWQVQDPNIIEVYGIPSYTPLHIMNSFGNTAFGTRPQQLDRLTVDNNISLIKDGAKDDDNTEHIIRSWGSQGILGICQNAGYFHGPSIIMYGAGMNSNDERDAGEMRLISFGDRGRGITFENFDENKHAFIPRMKVMKNGQVIIGDQAATGNYGDFRLSVDGSIVCKKAVVQISSWADNVFEQDYQLPALSEVETYIKANNHLPDVPSEQCVIEHGVDVGEMNKILLKKVEELTLYMIEMKKENAHLQNQINELRN